MNGGLRVILLLTRTDGQTEPQLPHVFLSA